MKRIILFFFVLFVTSVSAQTLNTADFQRMGLKSIRKMRKVFNIPEQTKLYATAYCHVCDLSTLKPATPADCTAPLTVSGWLSKVYNCWRKVYVYDDQLKYVLVDNFADIEGGGYERKSYLGTKHDRIIAQALQANKFDCVVEVDNRQHEDAKQLVLICIKKDGMYRAVIKGEKATLQKVTKDDALIEPSGVGE